MVPERDIPVPGPAAAAPEAADEVVALRDVGFGYEAGRPVLSGVSIGVRRGSIVGIVGPSGCGKSTLLYLMANLMKPTAGAVQRNLQGGGRHDISMVFQKDTVLPWLTVEENVRMFARFKAHGLRRGRVSSLLRRGRTPADDELERRVADLLRMVKLDDRAGDYPARLSGGMRRRLAFLTGVAPQPELLLLDEPFSAVDEPTRIGIHQDAFDVIRSLGMTAILVTHDLAEAVAMCDEVLILGGRPAKVAHRHAVGFGRRRTMLGLRGEPDFLSLYGRLWDDLSAEIAR